MFNVIDKHTIKIERVCYVTSLWRCDENDKLTVKSEFSSKINNMLINKHGRRNFYYEEILPESGQEIKELWLADWLRSDKQAPTQSKLKMQ